MRGVMNELWGSLNLQQFCANVLHIHILMQEALWLSSAAEVIMQSGEEQNGMRSRETPQEHVRHLQQCPCCQGIGDARYQRVQTLRKERKTCPDTMLSTEKPHRCLPMQPDSQAGRRTDPTIGRGSFWGWSLFEIYYSFPYISQLINPSVFILTQSIYLTY